MQTQPRVQPSVSDDYSFRQSSGSRGVDVAKMICACNNKTCIMPLTSPLPHRTHPRTSAYLTQHPLTLAHTLTEYTITSAHTQNTAHISTYPPKHPQTSAHTLRTHLSSHSQHKSYLQIPCPSGEEEDCWYSCPVQPAGLWRGGEYLGKVPSSPHNTSP